MTDSTSSTPGASLLDPRCPYEYYEGLREQGDLIWDPGISSWIAPTYAAVRQVYIDDVSFRRPSPVDLGGERYADIFGRRRLSALTREDRARMRKWWVRIFSRKAAEQWRGTLVGAIVDAAIDRVAPTGRVEVYSEFAKPITLQVIAGVMDLPYCDERWLAQCRRAVDQTQAFVDASRFGFDSDVADRALAATRALNSLLEPFVEARRDGTGSDVISMMWRDGPDLLPHWDADDVYTTAREMFMAGSDTTKIALTNALYLAVSNPPLARRLREGDPPLIEAFVEEALRLHGTIHFRSRIATRDTEVQGCPVRAGERVFAVNASANRDDVHYARPQALDLDRRMNRDHMAFATGPAGCFGATLARVELQEGVVRFLRRLPNAKLAADREPPAFIGLMMRVHQPLHVAFSPSTLAG